MGQLLKATCSCGYASSVMQQSISFAYFETGTFYERAYCDPCGVVLQRSCHNKTPKCALCKSTRHFYFENCVTPPELHAMAIILNHNVRFSFPVHLAIYANPYQLFEIISHFFLTVEKANILLCDNEQIAFPTGI